MSVRQDAEGRRLVSLEVEVPGTPEQVWQAMATGPGVSAWFVPTQIEERVGGTLHFAMGPGMESAGTVTEWSPPHRFAYEERDWATHAPPLATEVTIEARAGGTCTVRMVHSLFASGDDWDDQLESFEAGWPGFFEVLRLYVRHHAGRPSAIVQASATITGTVEDGWTALHRALGFDDEPTEGSAVEMSEAGPALHGVVAATRAGRERACIVRVTDPQPGTASFGAFAWDDKVMLSLSLYFYGPHAEAAAADAQPQWQAWMDAVAQQI